MKHAEAWKLKAKTSDHFVGVNKMVKLNTAVEANLKELGYGG